MNNYFQHKAFPAYLERQFARAGIPRMYWEDPETNMELDQIEATKNLYLSGKVGRGKTHMAARFIKAKIINSTHLYGESQFINHSKVSMLTVSQFLNNLKQGFENGDMTEAEVMELYSTQDLLTLDDLGADKLSEWALSKLFDLIDARYANLRPTIVTSNFTPSQLCQKFGSTVLAQAITSRLKTYDFMVLKGKDRREQNQQGVD